MQGFWSVFKNTLTVSKRSNNRSKILLGGVKVLGLYEKENRIGLRTGDSELRILFASFPIRDLIFLVKRLCPQTQVHTHPPLAHIPDTDVDP